MWFKGFKKNSSSSEMILRTEKCQRTVLSAYHKNHCKPSSSILLEKILTKTWKILLISGSSTAYLT